MDLASKKCVPCELGSEPLPLKKINQYLKIVPDWELVEQRRIKKSFKFKGFKEAMGFVNKVAEISENESHHPNIKIFYNKVMIELTTHSIGGLSDNDFILAAKIDGIMTH